MSAPATTALAVPRGVPPTLEWVGVTMIGVDPTYQRSTANPSSQSLIRRIARDWDWGLCQPLSCTRRGDGSIWAVDGQHRLAAARARGDIPHLPCVVVRLDDPAAEASAFVALNRQRRPLGAIDLFRAALAAGEDEAAAIGELMTQAGLRLAPANDWRRWEPGMILAITGIVRAFRARGARVVEAALTSLALAYPDVALRYGGTILEGLFDVYSGDVERADIKPIALATTLGRKLQEDWVAAGQLKQRLTGLSRSLALASVILEAHRLRLATVGAASPSIAPQRERALPVARPVRHAAPELLAGRVWCEQCDTQVTPAIAAACKSAFCKGKVR